MAGKEVLELQTDSRELAGWIEKHDGIFAFVACTDAHYLHSALSKIARILIRLNTQL